MEIIIAQPFLYSHVDFYREDSNVNTINKLILIY